MSEYLPLSHSERVHNLQLNREGRYTRRMRRHSSRRLTLRAQTGGGSLDEGFKWYHIADPTRANYWNAALSMKDSGLQQFAGVITTENWGTGAPAEKLALYIQLVERQDNMFRMALNIIYSILKINPQSESLLDDVIAKLGDIERIGEDNLKNYILDVLSLITGLLPNSDKMNKFLQIEDNHRYAEKIARLMKDPLHQIILWPERVSNVFIEYIARVLIQLKNNSTELDNILAEKNTAIKAIKQQTFANMRNAYIQSNAVLVTSLGLRDGFFLWQETQYPQAPLDTCPKDTRSDCKQSGISDISFWFQFCNQLSSTIEQDESNFKSESIPKSSILFSKLVAYIYKIYKTQNIDVVRRKILTHSNFSNSTALAKNSTYRPKDIIDNEIPTANILRVLDPAQYTFLLHLVYTMSELEKEKLDVATTSS